MARETYQFVVIGSGFGGSIMSMVLRRMGKTVLMLERGGHPRFAIGESSTPFANLLLEKIAEDYDLPFLRHLSEWGSWQEHFPKVSAGLKRGFTFFHHPAGGRADFTDRSAQLLVAASPNDRVADTHWYRPEVDHFLAQEAIRLGVEYADQTSVESIIAHDGGWEISLLSGNERRSICAEFLIDASGASGALAHQFSISTLAIETMPATSGVWAHFRNVRRLEEMQGAFRNTSIPYPPDDAAVHHLFPGGWAWVLRFNNEITSAGAAFTEQAGICARHPEEAWKEILQKMPSLAETFRDAEAITPFYSGQQLSFVRKQIAGRGWAMLPSAGGFVDPLLSTGFALTLLGVERLSATLTGDVVGDVAGLERYEKQTRLELEATADLVSALYAKLGSFEEFALLTMVYFAAMSFTESAWRLGKRSLASGFLLTNDDRISRARREICAVARSGGSITRSMIQSAIEPFDIAGLTDWTRNHWYPVNLQDLKLNAHKLGVTEGELERLIRKVTGMSGAFNGVAGQS